MDSVVYLANWYDGPLMRKGHGQVISKPGNPAHGWHWLQKTEQGWESIALVAGEAEHFEVAPQAIRHARDHGFEVQLQSPRIQDYICCKGLQALASPHGNQLASALLNSFAALVTAAPTTRW